NSGEDASKNYCPEPAASYMAYYEAAFDAASDESPLGGKEIWMATTTMTTTRKCGDDDDDDDVSVLSVDMGSDYYSDDDGDYSESDDDDDESMYFEDEIPLDDEEEQPREEDTVCILPIATTAPPLSTNTNSNNSLLRSNNNISSSMRSTAVPVSPEGKPLRSAGATFVSLDTSNTSSPITATSTRSSSRNTQQLSKRYEFEQQILAAWR
ncbi:MAG: hypothetical protein SGILL_009911, partial [Bacillariaceae sp.]